MKAAFVGRPKADFKKLLSCFDRLQLRSNAVLGIRLWTVPTGTFLFNENPACGTTPEFYI